MSNKSEQDNGLVRIKENIPYFGKGVDELVATIRKLFADNKYPQKIVLEAGVKYIYLEKLVSPSEAKENETLGPVQQSLPNILRNIKLEEYEYGELTPIQQLAEMFAIIHTEGLDVCHVAVGDKSKFQRWLGIRIPQTNLNLFGIPITVTGEIPEDVFVIFGGPTRTSDPYEVRYAVKNTI